ncbi:response regulator transcription factor [Lentzea sp. NPDC059081]|uniref:response regulator transcription factor n=1 Tax=Lentzea sp. NPDC059081 TaxID=3346719 RepID=UPI003682B6E4
MSRIPVIVRGTDAMSQAGVAATLRYEQEVQLFHGTSAPPDAVAVVIGDSLDDDLLRVLKGIRTEGSRRVVLVIRALDDPQMLEAIELGVSVLVWRAEAEATRLLHAVQKAAAGQPDLPPDLLTRFLTQVARAQRDGFGGPAALPSGLAKREVAVLRLVADGLDTREIADHLCYSERTIKNILHDVTNRFHLRNRSHAVAYAMREGLL